MQVYLERTLLEGAGLNGARLEGAELDNTHLEGANLFGAHLEQTDFFGPHLEGAWLDGVDLSKARHLTQEQIDVARGDVRTKLPSYLTAPDH